MKNKTIGVIGTRRRDSREDLKLVFKEFLKLYKEGDSICSGLCPKGGDKFAVMIASRLKISEEKRVWFPADWKKYGKAAGFIRNTDIAANSDILIACVAEDRTGGTEDTIRKWKACHKNMKNSLS